jgi:hypothetical protein
VVQIHNALPPTIYTGQGLIGHGVAQFFQVLSHTVCTFDIGQVLE